MKIAIVIPARYGSSRLPGKPLLDIGGKPMIQHVYEKAKLVGGVSSVIVATDDQRIVDAVDRFGGYAELTASTHQSGTDRLIEIANTIRSDIYVNIQGDEPLIRVDDIEKLIDGMRVDCTVSVGTLCHPICEHEAADPNTVKVVRSENGDALYFSRAMIPFDRDKSAAQEYLKHVGVYAYRHDALKAFEKAKQSPLELSEKLEQLRFLSLGINIRAYIVEPTGPGVDTPDCLERVRSILLYGVDPVSDNARSLQNRMKAIKLVVADVDGVLTDGSIFYTEQGESMKCFHVRDGLGMRMLEELGIRVAVVSGKDSPALRKRIDDLKITCGLYGISDKFSAISSIQEKYGISKSETAYIGDDSIDIPAFNASGLTFAVSDADEYIKNKVDVVLERPGGKAAFREVADAIIKSLGNSSVLETQEGYSTVMSKMVQ